MLSLSYEKAGCGKPLLTCRVCRGRLGRECHQCSTTAMVCTEHDGLWRGR
jgi:hypothetical protein